MPSIVSRLRSAAAGAISGFRTPARTRGFNGAQTGRLYSDWIASATSSDAEIRGSFRRLLDRSRDLERNNDYQRGYLRDCEDNIVGAARIDLRMACGEWVAVRGRDPVFQADRLASRLIQEAWREWSQVGTCTADRRRSWHDVKLQAVRAVPRDGNFLVRKITGPAARNRFGFRLQLWEVDHLDLTKFSGPRSDGSEIRFGIEFSAEGEPLAYHLFARHPGDTFGASSRTLRIPAAEIYHVCVLERPEQTLGLPWAVSAITRLRQLGAFEEAAVIAARLGASKAGFFKTTGQSEWSGETDGEGRAVMAAEPGQFEQLPQGWDVSTWNPEYPNIETSEFRKAMLRGVATSLGTSYTTLGNDLESVNYSSARVGLLDERETWKMHQLFFESHFFERVFADWLEQALLAGAINLPLAKFAKFNRPRFKSRRWSWIDPLKEVEAAKGAIALRLSSRRQIADEAGGDIEEIFADNLADEELAEDLGLELTPPDAPARFEPEQEQEQKAA